MALLNVAYTLHRLGRHVLVVDLDLEAPGVSGFLRRNEELAETDSNQPNDQNINGTAEFLKVVGLEASSKGAKWDDDDPEDDMRSPGLGQKPTLLVASPVPFGEMEMKAARFAEMEKILGAAPDARISYHPRLSIIETVFCRDGVAGSINQEYEDITMRMLSMVGDHQDQWERRNEPFGKDETLDLGSLRRFAALLDEENLRRIAGLRAFLADQLSAQAKQKTGAEADALFAAAGKKFEAALAVKPDYHSALYNLACLHALKNDIAVCLAWLTRAMECGAPLTQEKLDQDSDFDPVRADPAFVAFREKLPS